MFDGWAPALARRTPWAYTVKGARGRGGPTRIDGGPGAALGPEPRQPTGTREPEVLEMGTRPTDGWEPPDDRNRTGRRQSAGDRRRGWSAPFETGTKRTPDEA